MASYFSLQPKSFLFSKSFGSKGKRRTKAFVPELLKLNGKKLASFIFQKNNVSIGRCFARYASSISLPSRAFSPLASSASTDEDNNGDKSTAAMSKAEDKEVDFNRVNCLVWVLHESAASFSLSVQSLGLPGTRSELTMAWNGKDVHEWHKRIAYQVGVYALLKTAIEVEMLLSLDRHNNAFPVKEILTPKINLVGEYIENQLNMKHADLVQWFKLVELPRISSFFIPLLKKWSMEYAGSGVAGIIVAISCCAAIGKLGSGRISCPMFTFSIEDILVELMDLSHSLVEVDKLHKLAIDAGFELNFLSHFGAKVMPYNKIEELEFWIGLAQKKLSAAFSKEIVVREMQNSHKKVNSKVHESRMQNSHEKVDSTIHESLQVQADSLATLGLFAYLGKKTRIFLSRMSVKDLDELVKDFLNYLECGILFIKPELASISAYECFMEIVTEEIEWLDFYATCLPLSNRERKRSKQNPTQAEKEIILSTVFTVCYDVFSGFAHFSRSTQQPLDAQSLDFLLQSQSLLTICLEDYRAVYDRSPELRKIVEVGATGPDQTLSVGINADELCVQLEVERKPNELTLEGCLKLKSQEGVKVGNSEVAEVATVADAPSTSTESSPVHESLLRRYGVKLVSTSTDVWMGTQLLCVDIMDALELFVKQLHGHKISKREKRKLKRTLNDIATLIPITILMLLPVSAVGHAAMLAAINRYMPSLIPTPYSTERLDVLKQLNRAKQIEVGSWTNLQDPPSSTNTINLDDPSANHVV